MDLATKQVMVRARADTLKDKDLQARLPMEEERSYYPGKWARSEDAYRALCPDNPMGLGDKQTHRALDDAMMEEWIPRSLFGAVS